jgi:hypothetical protein
LDRIQSETDVPALCSRKVSRSHLELIGAKLHQLEPQAYRVFQLIQQYLAECRSPASTFEEFLEYLCVEGKEPIQEGFGTIDLEGRRPIECISSALRRCLRGSPVSA